MWTFIFWNVFSKFDVILVWDSDDGIKTSTLLLELLAMLCARDRAKAVFPDWGVGAVIKIEVINVLNFSIK